MINTPHNLIDHLSYAAYLREGDTIRQVGIVSGATAKEMIANSDAPQLLDFQSLEAARYLNS